MSDVNGTCEYVLDPDDPETWGGELGEHCSVEETWSCPYEAQKGEALCIFHLPLKQKENKIVIQHLKEKIENLSSENVGELRIYGAVFGDIELKELDSKPDKDTTIRLDHSDFNGKVELKGVKVGSEINFSGCNFNRGIIFSGVEFAKGVKFTGSRFLGRVNFDNTHFFGEARFSGGVTFTEPASFINTKFCDKTNFLTAYFEDSCEFTLAKFKKKARFEDGSFQGDASFVDARFHEVSFNVDFSGEAKFYNCIFESPPNFSECGINGGNFVDVELSNADFSGSNLTDAVITDANLSGADLENAILSRATLFGADLRGAKLSGAVLGDIRIDEDTKFLGKPSSDTTNEDSSIWDTWAEFRSNDYCVYDFNYIGDNKDEDIDKAKSVYRALEEIGGKAARTQLQSESFIRRQDLQQQQYWNNASDASNPLKWLINFAKGSRAKVARATLLYGESPWRVIAWSLGIIFSFALLYPLGGWIKPTDGDPITYTQIASNYVEILNLVYYSTLTYTALGFGDFQPVGLGRLLTTLETSLGAVMLALLVFIFGRRAAR